MGVVCGGRVVVVIGRGFVVRRGSGGASGSHVGGGGCVVDVNIVAPGAAECGGGVV